MFDKMTDELMSKLLSEKKELNDCTKGLHDDLSLAVREENAFVTAAVALEKPENLTESDIQLFAKNRMLYLVSLNKAFGEMGKPHQTKEAFYALANRAEELNVPFEVPLILHYKEPITYNLSSLDAHGRVEPIEKQEITKPVIPM